MSKIGKVFGGGGDGGAGQIAADRQKDEADRASQIKKGIALINERFRGFGKKSGYLDDYKQAYTDYYLPQLDDQYQEAQDQNLFALSDAGLLKSTARNKAFTDLAEDYELQKGGILNKAEIVAGDHRANINAERDSIINQLLASANPSVAAASARQSANALRASTPNFSPLAAVLAPTVGAGANYLEGRRARAAGADLSASDPRSTGSTYTVRG